MADYSDSLSESDEMGPLSQNWLVSMHISIDGRVTTKPRDDTSVGFTHWKQLLNLNFDAELLLHYYIKSV